MQGGAGVLLGVSGAAMHAGHAITSAGMAATRAGFRQAFASARSAAAGFASGASAAMRAFTSSVSGAVSAVRGAASSMGSSFASILSHIHPVRLAMAGLMATVGSGFLGTKLAADAEATQASFKTMLGGGDIGALKAKNLMGNVSQFAAATPFELPELTGATRKLLAFGSSERGVMNDLKMMGDVASGIQAPIGEIAEIYGKARVQGRLFAEDINQLTGRGIPIIGELAKQFGVSESKVKKLVEDGKVGFPELEQAFRSMTSEGGKFYGMMAEQSTTAKGLWSTLIDNVSAVAREIGTALLPASKSVMSSFIAMTGNASSFIDPLKVKSSGLSDAIVAKLPSVVGWLQRAWTFEKAWLQTLGSALSAVGRGLGGLWNELSRLLPATTDIGDGFLKALANVRFFFDNYETYAAIGVQRSMLFASNSYEQFKTFFVNVGQTLVWLADNWKSVFQTMWNFTRSVITNMGKNLGQFFVAVKSWLKGEGFNFKWTGLLEGFEATIKELPVLMKANIKETTPEIQRLYDELAKAEAEAAARNRKTTSQVEASKAAQPETGGSTGEPMKPTTAESASSKEARFGHFGLAEFAKHLQEGAASKDKAAEDRDKKKTNAVERTAKATEKIAKRLDNASSGGIRIEP
jgi:tape measure domain-containing protein